VTLFAQLEPFKFGTGVLDTPDNTDVTLPSYGEIKDSTIKSSDFIQIVVVASGGAFPFIVFLRVEH
jgi:hypothetical protein